MLLDDLHYVSDIYLPDGHCQGRLGGSSRKPLRSLEDKKILKTRLTISLTETREVEESHELFSDVGESTFRRSEEGIIIVDHLS